MEIYLMYSKEAQVIYENLKKGKKDGAKDLNAKTITEKNKKKVEDTNTD